MPRRDKLKREQDLARLSQIVARRRVDDATDPKTQAEIGRSMGVSQMQISLDLRTLLERWRRAALDDTGTLVAAQRASLMEVVREAYAEWERSKVDRTEETRERVANESAGGDKSAAAKSPVGARTKLRATTRTQPGLGNPAYLSVVLAALSDERLLLGLNRPTKIAPTSPDGETAYRAPGELSDAELAVIAAGGGRGTAET